MFGNKTPKGTIIHGSRTFSKDYQSKVVGFSLEVPNGVPIHEALELMDFMIETRLSGKVPSRVKAAYARTYSQIFEGQDLADFLKVVDNQPPVKDPNAKKRNQNRNWEDFDARDWEENF